MNERERFWKLNLDKPDSGAHEVECPWQSHLTHRSNGPPNFISRRYPGAHDSQNWPMKPSKQLHDSIQCAFFGSSAEVAKPADPKWTLLKKPTSENTEISVHFSLLLYYCILPYHLLYDINISENFYRSITILLYIIVSFTVRYKHFGKFLQINSYIFEERNYQLINFHGLRELWNLSFTSSWISSTNFERANIRKDSNKIQLIQTWIPLKYRICMNSKTICLLIYRWHWIFLRKNWYC